MWIHVRTAVLTSTHNLCFRAKIRKKNEYHCKPQFYYIKVGFKGVYIIWTCFHDEALPTFQHFCKRPRQLLYRHQARVYFAILKLKRNTVHYANIST